MTRCTTTATWSPANWQSRLPDNSTPYTSTIVFLVRKGNPKGIKDWDDLVKPGVGVIAPNPKTSGGARWVYLAAYGYALKNNHGDTNAATRFVDQLYGNVKVLGTGARDSTTSFVQNGLGDVLVNWENEALLAVNSPGRGKYQIIYPSLSILAEPPVSVVDKVVDQRGTRAIAEAYLNFLWTPAGQEIAASHFFRPRLAEVARAARKDLSQNPDLYHRRTSLAAGPARRKFILTKEAYLTKSSRAGGENN